MIRDSAGDRRLVTEREDPIVQTQQMPDTESCWALLKRIAASAPLKRATRLQELLFYVGKRSLQDGCGRVNEQEIGANVFHRPESYDTSVDNIVRTNVSDLRKRIETYFHFEGEHEPLVMEIPRGSYIPVFRYRVAEAEARAETPIGVQPPPIVSPKTVIQPAAAVQRTGWMPWALGAACTVIVALACACIYLWAHYQALYRPLFSWQSKPAVAEFWSRYLGANANTDVVVSDTGIGLAEALSRRNFTLNDYLTRGYIGQLDSAKMSADSHVAIDKILSWNLANPDEFLLARHILALDPLGRSMHLYNARNYMPELVERDNVILIGARKSNPWDELFDNWLNFITEFDNPRVINRSPAKGEAAVYLQTNSDGYCVVAFMPNTSHNGLVLLIEGTNAEATEAAGDFLLSDDQLSGLKNKLHVNQLPYFEVLLKVSAVRGTPLSASVVAYRTHPQQH